MKRSKLVKDINLAMHVSPSAKSIIYFFNA